MTPVAESAKKHLEDILTFFGVNTDVEAEVSEDGETINLSVEPESGGHLIGHRGETLAALQHMLNMLIRRQTEERVYVHIDIGGYRKARLEKLEAQANEAAARIAESGEEETLPQMNPAERRHIHSYLNDHDLVETESRGEGKGRRLVVKKKS